MYLRQILPLLLLLLPTLLLLPVAAAQPTEVAADGFANEAFRDVWVRTDGLIATGQVSRSWIWGERAGERRYERFQSVGGANRLVQYFDKARMEISDPNGDRASSWFVTSGLLVVEMITGKIQIGESHVEQRAPADIPIAGDVENNADALTYALLNPITSVEGSNKAPSRIGERVSTTYSHAGIGEQADLALPETEIVQYEEATGHNIPRIFSDFLHATGPVLENGGIVQGTLVDPLFAFGHPITEPYWMQAQIDGTLQPVLFQAFERRLLTYTPSNPDPWKVEMGNVGQHYYRWRYGRALHYAQPPLADGVRSYETTLDIPTYAYEQALVPTTPDDAIYPYPRLDRSKVGAVQPRSYRAIVVENRFLELTFLPELGGRLYKAVDKATGHNIFYQNPVIKPSTFGQRGWWIGAGGLEWAAPTEEHGYLEYLPWDVSLTEGVDAVTVDATTTEKQTGMEVAGAVTLRAEEGRFHAAMRVSNNTNAPHPLQMWTNAALSPGGTNRIGAGLAFVAPTDRLIVHATQDSRLPGAHGSITWPTYRDVDLSYPANWEGYLGAFSPEPLPFLGAYDTEQDEGAAVVHAADAVGAKLFAFSKDFDRTLYTDDGSDYLELWSGAQATFWDYPPLEVGGTRTINADWLPLWGMSKLVAVSLDAALGIVPHADDTSTVTLVSPKIVSNAVVVVWVDNEEVFRSSPLDLRPDMPLAIDLPLPLDGKRVRIEAPGLVITAP